MKGLVGYVVAIAIVSVLTIASFYLLGEMLDKETAVSVISSKISRTINEIEFSKLYFKKYFENEINSLRSSGVTDENIIKKISEETVDLEMENSISNFKVNDIHMNDTKFVISGEISSFTENKDFKVKAEYSAEFII